MEILLRSYNGLGNLHHARKEWAESVRQYERALAIAQKTEDSVSEAGIETNLGIVFHRMQQNAKALPHLKAAIHALKALDTRGLQENFLLVTALLESGEIVSQDRKFPDADFLFNEVADLTHNNLGLESFHFPLAAALNSAAQQPAQAPAESPSAAGPAARAAASAGPCASSRSFGALPPPS